MKKSILFTIILTTLLAINIMAQEQPVVISVNVGWSLVGDLMASTDLGSDYDVSVTPAFQLNVDKKVTNIVSIGIATSLQMITMKYEGYEYLDGFGALVLEDFEARVSRINFAVRPLFHYGGNESLDMYSGLRLGFTKWNYTDSSNDPNYDVANEVTTALGFNFAPQLILFGMQYYFSDNIGANFEFSVGSPHYISGGINFRF